MTKRVAVLQFFHEASCIAPQLVTYEDFRARHHMSGAAVEDTFGATENWMGGVLGALRDHCVRPEIGLCTAALPGGPVASDAFDQLFAELLWSLDDIRQNGPLTHVFLLLHGAILVQGVADPEGDIVRAVRTFVGPHAKISVALDFHANPGPGIVEGADIVIGGQLYPHTDTRERGRRIVELAFDRAPLRTAHVPLGVDIPMPHQHTTSGPFAEIANRARGFESETIRDITLLGGFPFSNAPFRGTSLLITGEGHLDAARIATDLRRAIDESGVELFATIPSPQNALPTIAGALETGRVVIADVGDNPGGGGTGDDTSLLAELLTLDRPFCFAFLIAPDLVAKATEAGLGGSVQLNTPRGPITSKVERLHTIAYCNNGPMMTGEALNGGAGTVLAIGASRILVSSLRVQAYDANAFRSAGVEPSDFDLIAIKSTAHFRASYAPLATGAITLVDSGGLSSPRRAPEFTGVDQNNEMECES